jgi:hypothetical protein
MPQNDLERKSINHSRGPYSIVPLREKAYDMHPFSSFSDRIQKWGLLKSLLFLSV